MDEEAPVIYGLDFQVFKHALWLKHHWNTWNVLQARSLCPQYGETEMVRFLIGTQSLKSENSIHCVEYDEESVLVSKLVYPHLLGEIWHIDAHPTRVDIVGTVHSKIFLFILMITQKTSFEFHHSEKPHQKMGATIFQMSPVPEIGQSVDSIDSSSPCQLDVLTSLDCENDSEVARFLWQPIDGNKLVTICTDSSINLWDFNGSGTVQVIQSVVNRLKFDKNNWLINYILSFHLAIESPTF